MFRSGISVLFRYFGFVSVSLGTGPEPCRGPVCSVLFYYYMFNPVIKGQCGAFRFISAFTLPALTVSRLFAYIISATQGIIRNPSYSLKVVAGRAVKTEQKMVVTSVLGFLGEHPGILVVLFLLYCFIYALSLLFAGPKPGRNPFGVRFLRPPPEKIVTEQKVRNTILKQSMHLHFSHTTTAIWVSSLIAVLR